MSKPSIIGASPDEYAHLPAQTNHPDQPSTTQKFGKNEDSPSTTLLPEDQNIPTVRIWTTMHQIILGTERTTSLRQLHVDSFATMAFRIVRTSWVGR
ncbi:uncharacterized protein TrAtP1_008707 [Trichoderma atroviride]|uniref:uncharacterized protein n=1 Tax=Hypocrea atroviridis TaxID=63577 RepID=UPI0033316CBC|nr:hypothetical protein TrAtP1_008707 [Trichoderma atroviride]